MSETPKKQLTAITSRNAISHTIAYLSDLAPNENGNYIRVTNTLGQNLAALDTAVANIPEQVDYSLTISAPQTPDTSYAAQYEFKQRGSTIATINIPKDMVVSTGVVVDITFDSETNKLKEGDTDVTEAIKGQTTPTASDAGKYIKLTIANKTNSTLYIKVSDLVDIYTAQQNATQVQLAISAGNEISATIVAGSIGTTELSSGVNASLAKADTALQASDVVSTYDAASTAPVNGVAVAAAIAAIPSVDISGKADKDTDAVEGNLAVFDANGNPVDSGKAASDFAEADHTHDSLVNGDASLNLSQAGVATVTIEGAGPAPVKGIFTVTGGTVSGTNPTTGEQVSYELASTTVEVPLTQSSTPPSYRGQVVVDGVGYFVYRSAEGVGRTAQDQLSVGVPTSSVSVVYDIDNTDYANPVLTLNSMGGAFTGSVAYEQVVGEPADVVKTLATTDDVQTTVNTAINALDATVTSTNGTNVQVQVTETNGKVTGVSITKDDTYAKPEGGIPGTDIADGAITTGKLSELNYFIFNDLATSGEYVGKKWKLSVLEGRLQIEGVEDGDAPYVPQGYPAYISMTQTSAGAAAPRDMVDYLWEIYIDDTPGQGYVCYRAATGSPRALTTGGYPSDDMNTLQPQDNDNDYVDLPWHINWMGNFTGRPTLVCEEGCPFTADMFELKWVNPNDINWERFPSQESGAGAPRKRLAKRK